MRYACFVFFLLASLPAWAVNEIDLLKTNDDVQRFLVRRVSRREFKDDSPFESDKAFSYGKARNTFFKVDLDHNGKTDLVIDGNGALLVVMVLGKRYRLYRLDMDTATELVDIDSTARPNKLVVRRRNQGADTLVYKFNGFIEYISTPGPAFMLDSLTLNSYWNGDLSGEVKIYRDLHATYTSWFSGGKPGRPAFYSGYYSRNTYNTLVALLNYIRPDQIKESYNNGSSHADHCRTFISYHGKTIEINDYGADGTFGLQQLYNIILQDVRDRITKH